MKAKLLTLLFGIFLILQAQAHVNLVYPQGGETFTAGETVNIQWEIVIPHNTLNWDLYFSDDGGNTWEALALDIPLDSLSYQWIVPDSETSQARIKIVMDNDGNDYSDASDDFSIAVITGISEFHKENGIKVFPNPMVENATVIFENPGNESFNFLLFNMKGQIVMEKLDISSNHVLIMRNSLISGLYYFQLMLKNGDRKTGRLVVK